MTGTCREAVTGEEGAALPRARLLHGMRRDGRRVAVWTAPLRMRPSFLILGAQRGGTTSLFAYLAQHPQVVAPAVKEIRFFDDHWARGAAWYRAHFPWLCLPIAGGPLVTGEATPYYLYHPSVPDRVAGLLPGVRTLVLLRNPVDRALSHYHMEVRQGHETLPLPEALAREADRLGAGPESGDREARLTHRRCSYVARGRYAEQVGRWFAALGRQNVLVLQSERFYTNPATTMERVHTFLGLRSWHPSCYRRYNEGATSDGVEAEVRCRLATTFAPYNEQLFTLLGERYHWD